MSNILRVFVMDFLIFSGKWMAGEAFDALLCDYF